MYYNYWVNIFPTFSACFYIPINFYSMNSNCSKKMISKNLQILGLQPGISKVFLDYLNNFFSQ